MNTRLTPHQAAPSGPVLWFATAGSIAMWMVHISALSALVPLREQHEWVVWVMHGLTVALAGVVLVGMRISWSYARIGDDDEDVPTPVGRTVFLGYLGLVIGTSNLVLIVYEGTLVILLKHGRF